MSNKVVLDKTIEDALEGMGCSVVEASGRFILMEANGHCVIPLNELEGLEDLLGADVCNVSGERMLLRWRTEVNT
jgi:hypothetical protein